MLTDEARLLNATCPEDAEEPLDLKNAEDACCVPLAEGLTAEPALAARPYCDDCRRPRRICLCTSLPPDGPLDTRTRVMLLVHPKEVQRPLGTAPLLRLCLRHLVVEVGDRFPEPEENPELHAALCEGGHRPVLVCPGNNAEEMRPPPVAEESEWPAAEEALFSQAPATLIFIDGRWPQAKSMVNRSTWLQQIPRAVLCPTGNSGYVFRKQPKEGCLSTLEAVAEALLALEGRRGLALKEALLKPFSQMVQLQCPFIPDMKDKNAKLEKEGLQPFHVEAVLEESAKAQIPEEVNCEGRWRDLLLRFFAAAQVNCVVRWGDVDTIEGREVVVMEVYRGSQARVIAKRRSVDLSRQRSRGHRPWVLPLSKVPQGSRMEAGALPVRVAGGLPP